MALSWKKFAAVISVAMLSALAGTPVAEAAAREYSFAVPAQFSPVEANRTWQPFLERLGEIMGTGFALRTYHSLHAYEDDVLKGGPDFAFLNPYLQVLTRKSPGYLPLARDAAPLVAVLLVRKDSPYRSVKDLDGRDFTFPSAMAVAPTYLRALLAEKEKLHFNVQFAGSHSNVLRHVAGGFVEAGAVSLGAFEREPETLRSQFREIYRSPGIAPHPLSVHPRVPVPLRQALLEALDRMARDEQGRRLLKAVQLGEPVQADYGRDYQPIEALRLERFVSEPQR
jgi:phosphonate transport system substrate-binding protein